MAAEAGLADEDSLVLRKNFRSFLLRRYHSLARAWRELDVSLHGQLAWNQFCRACREVGYSHSVRSLWEALDTEKVGFVTLYDIDEAFAQRLETFAVEIWSTFGTVEAAWQNFDKNGIGRVPCDAFVSTFRSLGFSGNAEAVYDALNAERTSRSISQSDFMFVELWFAPRKPEAQSPFHEKVDAARELAGSEAMEKLKPNPSRRVAGQRSVTNRDVFKRLLIKHYGNYVRAWRLGLDLDHNGRLDFKEFSIACKDIGYAGKRTELWKELDSDVSGVVSLGELDEPTAYMLEIFYSHVIQRFGTWEKAWAQCFDITGFDRVTVGDFVDGCRAIGWGGNGERLFDLLDVDRAKYLTLETCSWICGGESPADSPLWETAGDFKITGHFKKMTKSQERKTVALAREARLRAQRFNDRDRTEVGEVQRSYSVSTLQSSPSSPKAVTWEKPGPPTDAPRTPPSKPGSVNNRSLSPNPPLGPNPASWGNGGPPWKRGFVADMPPPQRPRATRPRGKEDVTLPKISRTAVSEPCLARWRAAQDTATAPSSEDAAAAAAS